MAKQGFGRCHWTMCVTRSCIDTSDICDFLLCLSELWFLLVLAQPYPDFNDRIAALPSLARVSWQPRRSRTSSVRSTAQITLSTFLRSWKLSAFQRRLFPNITRMQWPVGRRWVWLKALRGCGWCCWNCAWCPFWPPQLRCDQFHPSRSTPCSGFFSSILGQPQLPIFCASTPMLWISLSTVRGEIVFGDVTNGSRTVVRLKVGRDKRPAIPLQVGCFLFFLVFAAYMQPENNFHVFLL